jgi:APA family basic amino acid/polyamine antiporter
MLGAVWAYSGWNDISQLGGEVKDPGRTLPRALIGGVGLVIVLYLLVNAAYFYVLSPQEILSVPGGSSVASEAVGRFLGRGAAGFVAAGMMVSAYGGLHCGMLTCPRLSFALARDGLLPRILGHVSANGVPVWSVLMVAIISAAFTLVGGFDVLSDMAEFVMWSFYGLTVATVFVLRRTRPDAERPYRVWGYPVMPALFVLTALFLVANTFIATPARAIMAFGLMILGLPLYRYYNRSSETH